MKPNQYGPMSAAAMPGIAGTIVPRRQSRENLKIRRGCGLDGSPGGRDA
jgi:hypothetical protein